MTETIQVEMEETNVIPGWLLDQFTSFPIEVKYKPECGRYVVAARDIEPGEIVLESEPFAITVSKAFRTNCCNSCMRLFTLQEKAKAIACENCKEIWFCSLHCFQESINKKCISHSPQECKSLKKVNGVKKKLGKDLIDDDIDQVAWFLHK